MLVAEADLSQFLNCGSVFFVFFFGPLQPPPPPKLQCTALSLMPFFQAGDVYHCVPNISYEHDIAQYEFSY